MVAKGATHVPTLINQIENPNCHLPESARAILKVLTASLKSLDENIAALDAEIVRRSKGDPAARRLMSIPGVGPITATAIVALAPPVETFRTGRDFAAWLGLTPLQRPTGGKQRLGATSKMGERTICRDGGTGQRVQGPTFHVRGNFVDAALVSGLSGQLPRPRVHRTIRMSGGIHAASV